MSASSRPALLYFTATLLVSCLLVALFTAVIYQQSLITEKSNNWVVHSYEVMRRTNSLLVELSTAKAGVQAYAISADTEYLDQYYAGITGSAAELGAMLAITTDNPDRQKNLVQLRRELDLLKRACAEQITPIRSKHSPAKDSLNKLEDCSNDFEDAESSVRELREDESDLLDKRIADSHSEQNQYLLTLFFGAVVSFGTLIASNVFIFFLMARSRKVSEELSRSETLFALIMNNLNDGIYDYNVVTGSIYFSSGYKAMLGYTDREHPDTLETFNSLIHPDDSKQTWEIFRRYAAKEIPVFNCIFRMRHRNGRWRWVMARGMGFWDDDNKLQRLIGTHTDITVQKEREEDLKQLNNELEGFTYIASHDLRVPLVNIKGFAGEMGNAIEDIKPMLQHLKPHLPDYEEERLTRALDQDIPEALKFIRSAVERMDKMTTSILDLSRIGRRESNLQEIDTNKLVQQCLEALAYEINSHKVEVVCNPLPNITSDPWALELIFGNILDNAVKYLDPERRGKIVIFALSFPSEAIFSISDNGRGIALTDQKRVFDIFRRAGNSGNVRGSGMGMAYVKAMVRKLNGRIWFDSELGKGTTFYFNIPIQAPAEDTNLI
jgi:PAS domain S-box-containing protein